MRKKVAIISSYKIRCGIASFADTIESIVGSDFDVEVIALDQFLLRHPHPKVETLGDEAIAAIGERLKAFDVINLQWEAGLLGSNYRQMTRRLKALFDCFIAAGKPVSIAAHTVIHRPPGNPLLNLLNPGFRYAERTHRLLRYLDSHVDLTFVAHTRRDRSYFKHVVGLKKVVDHPLSYMRAGWSEMVSREAPAYRRELDAQVGAGKKIIGTFGFLSDYKGMETAIRAMRHLPDDHVLMVYGEVHGESIRPWVPVNAYVSKLVKETEGTPLKLRQILAQSSEPGANIPGLAEIRSELLDRSRSIADRVFFKGSPDDKEFAIAVKAVDACVFPYLEIGQSASGPVSQAVELGQKTALSRTKAFTELASYYPKSLSFFDIGNDIELAQLLRRLVSEPFDPPPLDYDQNSLRAFYSALFNAEALPMAPELV